MAQAVQVKRAERLLLAAVAGGGISTAEAHEQLRSLTEESKPRDDVLAQIRRQVEEAA